MRDSLRLIIHGVTTLIVCSGLTLFSGTMAAQTSGTEAPNAGAPADRAAAYYNFSMGHMYAELAGSTNFRSEYVDKAIEHYKAALKADPSASAASEELTDLYIQAGRFNDAVTEAEDLLKRDPENLEARRMLGRIYSRLLGDLQQNRINENMLRKAIEQYKVVTERDPSDVDSWLMLGRLYKVAQNAPDSEKAYKKALELDPDNEYALSGLTVLYSELGDTKNAIEMSKKLAEQNPRPQHLNALAEAYEQAHDYASAASTRQKALEMAPRDVETKKKLAEDLLLSDQTDAALKLYDELAQADPRDFRIPLRLSQIYRQKRDFAKAREAQEKARQIDPDNIEIRFNEVNLFEAEGKYGDAIARLKDILDSTSRTSYSAPERANRVILLERLALLYRENQEYPLAVEQFQKLAQTDPDAGARAAAQIVDTWRQAKEFTKAEQEADAAAQKYPNDRTVKLVRASLLADLGRTEQAAALTKQLLDGSRNDRETYLALAQVYDKGKKYDDMARALDGAEKVSESKDDKETVYFMRGAMYERTKKLDLAEAEFRKVLDINPQNASALNYLGYMLADRNVRLAEAQKLISKALELEPNNGAFLDSLGWVAFRMGRLDDAETYLRQALERVSRDPTVHDHLGDVYLQKGKLREAIAQWEISLREWQTSSKAEMDPAELAKVQKKLESARVRQAREGAAAPRQ